MNGIVQRPAASQDQRFLADAFILAMRQAIEDARGTWDELRERAQFIAQLELENTNIIELVGQPIGFLMLRSTMSESELHTVCLLPGHQNQGIGTHVLRQLIKSANSSGRPLTLSVLKSNPRAVALYERLGFRLTRQTEHHIHLRYTGSRLPNGEA